MALKKSLRLLQLVEVIRTVLDVPVRGHQKTASPGSGVLHDLAWLRLHQSNHTVNQRTWREILSGARLFLIRVLFQKAFIEVPETFLPRREPVELVNGISERLEVGGLAKLGLRVGEDGEDNLVFGLFGIAKIEQKL